MVTASALNDRLESYATNDRVDGISSDVDQLKASASTFATKDYVDAEVGALSAAMGSYATNGRVDGLEASVSATNERVVVIENMLLFDDLTN